MTHRCRADVPLTTELCKLPGVNNTDTWLTEYNPYAEGVLAARQLRCAELSVTAVDAAVAADRGSACWSNTCALMHSLDELARNLGMQSAEAFTYLVMLAGSFGGADDDPPNDLACLHISMQIIYVRYLSQNVHKTMCLWNIL